MILKTITKGQYPLNYEKQLPTTVLTEVGLTYPKRLNFVVNIQSPEF